MMTEEHDDKRSKRNMMTGGARNMIDRVKQKAVTLMKAGEENENKRSPNLWMPFTIDAKGGEKNGEKNGESMILTKHKLLLSVAINDKGGDCWKLLIELSLMPTRDQQGSSSCH